MVLRVDGDGCPDIGIMETLAARYDFPMVVYTDSSHVLHCKYAEVVVLDTWSQSVDIKLVNAVEPRDIVVTQDYGVAVVVLAKQARVVHPKGLEYTDDTIMEMLAEKYKNQKLRKRNIRTRGPKKRTKEDTKTLCNTLELLIKS